MRPFLLATAGLWLAGLAACDQSLEAKCRGGDGAACGMLGDRLRDAVDSPIKLRQACQFYREACDQNHLTGCANLGALLAQRKCTGTKGEVLRVLERACTDKNAAGCNNLGVLLRDGTNDVAADKTRAVAVFRKACPGTATACDSLGAMLIETDKTGATAAFQAGCDSEDKTAAQATCCFKLGLSHENGWGTPVNKPKAQSLYTFTCGRPAGEGCYRLGLLELTGDASDLPKAATHFERACNVGSAGGCNNLGLMYGTGEGVAKDAARALTYLQRACDGDEFRACANLGSRYVQGDGAPSAPSRGRKLLARACAGGVAEACVPPAAAAP